MDSANLKLLVETFQPSQIRVFRLQKVLTSHKPGGTDISLREYKTFAI